MRPSNKVFSSKNSRSKDSTNTLYKCKGYNLRRGEPSDELITSDTLKCDCVDPNNDMNQIPEDYDPSIPDYTKNIDVAKRHISRMLAQRENRDRSTSLKPKVNSAGNNDQRKRVPKWITLEDGIFVHYFNVFNNSDNVNQVKLKSILDAITKDTFEIYANDYGTAARFVLHDANGIKDPSLFQGDKMAIFVGSYDNGAFHYLNGEEPANTFSFPVGGSKLDGYGIKLPEGSNFHYVPYAVISSNNVENFYGNPNNIYAVSPETVPKETFHQMISLMISHEVKEVLGNDTTLNWVMFDHYAPTVANWNWGIFDNPEDPNVCTNSEYGFNGPALLPPFLKMFPLGGLMFAVKEVGDVVSAAVSGFLNSYELDGWRMVNYPLPTFWQPYNSDVDLKYDHLGYVKYPLEPYGGMHQLVIFISFDDGKTRLLEVNNKGPVTAAMRGAPKSNNFPVNYVVVKCLNVIEGGTDIAGVIESLENYGPSSPDRT